MNVNHDISKKVDEKVKAIEKFKKFDIQREDLISEAIKEFQSSKIINLNKINNITKEMNLFANKQQLPQRKIVTKEMFMQYITEQDM